LAPPTIELHGKSVSRPTRIDLHAVDVEVGARPHETVPNAEGNELILKDRAGQLRALALVLYEDGLQSGMARARAVASAAHDLPQICRVDCAEVLSLAEGLGEAVARDDVGEVDQGPSDGGDRDAFDGGDVSSLEGGGVVSLDAERRTAHPPLGRHIRAQAARCPQPVQRRRLAVAECGTESRPQHRCQPASLDP
jgi:hypothetical protein